MAALKLLSLATAAIFLLDTKAANASSAGATANTAVGVDCSAAMNAARKRVGFTELTLGKEATEILPIGSSTDAKVAGASYVDQVCEKLKAVESGTPVAKSAALNGTYAHAIQEGANADCEAAVDYWKAALPNFTGLPPTYTAETAKQPEGDPPLDEDEEGEGDDEGGDKQPVGGVPSRMGRTTVGGGATTTEKEVKALVCITTPSALTESTAPYTQSQWDQITTGINGSGAVAVPSLLGLAAAAVGVLLL